MLRPQPTHTTDRPAAREAAIGAAVGVGTTHILAAAGGAPAAMNPHRPAAGEPAPLRHRQVGIPVRWSTPLGPAGNPRHGPGRHCPDRGCAPHRGRTCCRSEHRPELEELPS